MTVDIYQAAAPVLALVIAWGFREWWLAHKERQKKVDERLQSHDTKLATAVENFTAKASDMTIAITRLQVQIENLTKIGEQMPKVVRDLDMLHAKVREVAK